MSKGETRGAASEKKEEPGWVSEEHDEFIMRSVTEHLSIPEKKKFDDYYHPSQMYDMCAVAEYFLRVMRPPYLLDEFPLKLGLMAAAGTRAHDHFQNNVLGPAGILFGDWFCIKCGTVQSEQFRPASDCKCGAGNHLLKYLEPQIEDHDDKVRGHGDGKIVIPSYPNLLLEMKSKSLETWKKIRTPSKKERLQASMYMHYLKLDACAYFFISRDDYQYKVVIEERNDALVSEARLTIHTIEDALSTGKCTTDLICMRRCADNTTARSKKCPFRKQCWAVRS